MRRGIALRIGLAVATAVTGAGLAVATTGVSHADEQVEQVEKDKLCREASRYIAKIDYQIEKANEMLANEQDPASQKEITQLIASATEEKERVIDIMEENGCQDIPASPA